jgi:hypothetical protein
MDDGLFGLPQLSHGPFTRTRIELHADGLDDLLRSSRETVYETDGVIKLREYLQDKFNEVRAFYNSWLADKEHKAKLTNRAGVKSYAMSRAPLVKAIKDVLDGSIDGLRMVHVPAGLSETDKARLVKRLDADLISDEGLIKIIDFRPLGPDRPIAIYEVADARLAVNVLHPFYANYAEHYSNPEPFELVALVEVLTEAHLYELQIPADTVRQILDRRDDLMRALVYDRELNAPLVVRMLEDATDDEKLLERAVAEGFRTLGFEVSPIGGSKEPDGIAVARIGIRNEATGIRDDYKITYDAKSSGKERIKAKDLNAAAVAEHRDKYKANFAVIIAPGFEGEAEQDSNSNQHARNLGPLITVKDFVRLIWAASTRQLGFSHLREFLEKCRSPIESRAWIDGVLAVKATEGPIKELLDAIWELQLELPDPVKIASLQMRPEFKSRNLRQSEIKAWLEAVSRFAGKMVSMTGDIVMLDAPPDRIMREVRRFSHDLPEPIRAGSIYASLFAIEGGPTKGKK